MNLIKPINRGAGRLGLALLLPLMLELLSSNANLGKSPLLKAAKTAVEKMTGQ